ncbi:MAG TPA: ribonuclease E/G, partial [Gammaproteobacteria bacterium]
MREEILVNVTPREVRAALLENGVVQEVLIERASRRGLVSNIYKGRVSRVLPGMQAAFVDIGIERTAFLHASDIARNPHGDQDAGDIETHIRDLVEEGQELLVQVIKDPLGTKGARLTTHITIPSRYIVMMPRSEGIGISARIDDDDERERLRAAMETITEPSSPPGFIVRTAAEGASTDALRADMLFLQRLWEAVEENSASAGAAERVYEDLPLEIRVLRDLLGAETERVGIDSEPVFARMKEFADRFMPQMSSIIERYS